MPIVPNSGALTARSFWSARFSRLYPVYAFSLLLSAGMLMQEVQAHTRLDFGLGVILTPLLLQGWHPAPVHLLEHACVDHVHRGVLLSLVPVV